MVLVWPKALESVLRVAPSDLKNIDHKDVVVSQFIIERGKSHDYTEYSTKSAS